VLSLVLGLGLDCVRIIFRIMGYSLGLGLG
jgi:hypothetical protein